MTGHYRVLPAADRDLDDQAAYLATQASLDIALRFYDAASSPLPRFPACPASASGGQRPTHAWRAYVSGGSKVSRST
jgi:plasmid stabilization system protein ParE